MHLHSDVKLSWSHYKFLSECLCISKKLRVGEVLVIMTLHSAIVENGLGNGLHVKENPLLME